MSYDDDDDDDYVRPRRPKMKMPGIIGFLSCTPLKIYLAVALISVIIYYGNNLLKGKIDFNQFSSLMCAIICSAIVIMFTCKVNFIVSWILAIGLSICAICFAMGKIKIPSKLY